MKKAIALWLALVCVCVMGLPAGAEEIILTPTYYDQRINSLLYNSLPEGMTYTERQGAMSGDFQLSSLLPLDDGGVLLTGSYVYFHVLKEESFSTSYEAMPRQTDAYAIALDAKGERLWSMRLSDPQAEGNTFYANRLQDGRIWLKYWGYEGGFGPSYFIVNDQGEIEEMLSNKKLRELDALGTLAVCEDGYIAGGARYTFGGFSPMEETDQLIKLDENLQPVWSVENPFGGQAYLWNGETRSIDTGEGTLWYGNYGDLMGTMRPGVALISHTGETLWKYDQAHEYALGWISAVAPLQDGGAIFACDIDPREAAPMSSNENSYLCWLDDSENLTQAKGYQADTGMEHIQAMHAFGDGFVIAGTLAERTQVMLLYVDAEGEVLGTAKLPAIEKDEYTNIMVRFAESSDGRLYAYGNEESMSTAYIGAEDTTTHKEAFYMELRPVDFIGAQ